MSRWIGCLLALWILTPGVVCAGAKGGPLTVFAAASLSDALKEIAVEFEQESGRKIYFNFGGSKILRLQIEHGAACDVFLAADQESVGRLFAKKLVEESTMTSILENQLVIVAAGHLRDDVQSLSELKLAAGDYVAVADPQTAPAGVYAMQALTQVGLLRIWEPFLVPTLDVRAAIALVESGNAKYGIVYRSDALVSPSLRVVYAVPTQWHDRIIYSAAVAAHTQNLATSRRFLEFLKTRESQRIFQKYGFQPVD